MVSRSMTRISWCGKVSSETESLRSQEFFRESLMPCDEPIMRQISPCCMEMSLIFLARFSDENCLPSTQRAIL